MHRHLVTVKVGVERITDERMELDGITFDKARTKCLDALTMEGWCAVEKHIFALNGFFEYFPHLRDAVFNKATSTANVEREFAVEESGNHEWTEQLEPHVLRKTAFVKFKIGADDDNGAPRVIDALAKQILAEIALFALQVVGKRLERSALRHRERTGGRGTFSNGIVEERINCFLQNTLLVSQNNFRCVNIDEFLETVVAVNNATIEIVYIRRCVTTAFKGNHRA